MATWALVIGVDKYWVKEASLRGAVRDALNVRQWLIESGSVPEGNITMLLAPDGTPVPGVQAGSGSGSGLRGIISARFAA